MSNKRARKKQMQRAFPGYGPGGSLMYVAPGQQQGVQGQTFYGTKATIPTGQTALFSPGQPLPAQPGVNPLGKPTQFRFPVSYNTFPPDRSMQNPDIPPFERLRLLARMDYGIGICENFLLRMILKLKLKVSLTADAVKGGAEEKNYQSEIKYFRNWFSSPDKRVTIHEWIQQAILEQTQIDELYVYKNRTYGKKLLGLEIVDGAQMKPLFNVWGRIPNGKNEYAYQQYPWGIPGYQYSMDQMLHRRETPATDTPYGRSRVERVEVLTNVALRKIKADLMHFTEGNIPAGIMEVPESLNWTPDQIDAYEQSWNALTAGNLQQLARIKFTQPGMKYVPFVQPSFDAVIDRYWLNIRASVYNIPMDSLGFTETSNRSTGEVQKDVLYEQSIGPFVAVYESIFTDCLQNEFEPSLHGELFEITFGGYEPPEDEQSKATTLTTYTNAGVLGLTAAAKLGGLPEDPDAPQIGRVFMSKDGPIFLDDMASDKMRNAALQAKLAGFQMAANPPEPAAPGGDEKPPTPGQKAAKEPPQDDKTMSRVVAVLERAEEEYDVTWAQSDTEDEAGIDTDPERANRYVASTGTRTTDSAVAVRGQVGTQPVAAEYRRWRDKAVKAVSSGKPAPAFVSDIIPHREQVDIAAALHYCETAGDVRAVFERAKERDTSFLAGAASNNGGHPASNKSAWKLRW